MTFQRENRYIVIKRKDLIAAAESGEVDASFAEVLDIVRDNLPTRECLVIESDWPEYEPAWQMIQARMEGSTPPAAQVQGELPVVVGHLALDEPFNGTEGLEIGEWEFVPERAVVESMLAVSTGEMVPLMTVSQHERIVAALSADNQRVTPPESVLAKPHPVAEAQGEREGFEAWIHTFDMPPQLEGEVFLDEQFIDADCYGQFVYEDHSTQRCWAAWQARAALSAPPAAGVPEGWKLVPVVPTLDMNNAGWQEIERQGTDPEQLEMRQIYQAAVNAAPTPPASEQQQAVVMSAAAVDVLAERRRQVEKEGWSTKHDEEHDAGVLAAGAAAYALNAVDQLHPLSQGANAHKQPACWPWAHAYWKPGVPRRDLVKAGALILAEIERWDRTISHPAAVNQGVTTEAGNGGDA